MPKGSGRRSKTRYHPGARNNFTGTKTGPTGHQERGDKDQRRRKKASRKQNKRLRAEENFKLLRSIENKKAKKTKSTQGKN